MVKWQCLMFVSGFMNFLVAPVKSPVPLGVGRGMWGQWIGVARREGRPEQEGYLHNTSDPYGHNRLCSFHLYRLDLTEIKDHSFQSRIIMRYNTISNKTGQSARVLLVSRASKQANTRSNFLELSVVKD